MRKHHLVGLGLWLGAALLVSTGANAAMFSPGSPVRAIDDSLIQRVGVGARLPALRDDYILVGDDDDDDGGGGGGYGGGGGGSYGGGGGYSGGGHHGGGAGIGAGIGLGMGIINMLGNQARRQQRYQENNNNAVQQRRIIIRNQVDVQRQIAKKKAQDEARILRDRLRKEAIAERNKIIKLKQEQHEYAKELDKKKKRETAAKEKKRIEQDYQEKKTTEKKAVEKYRPSPTPGPDPYVRPDPTPVVPTPVVTDGDEEKDVINNNAINIIYPPPSCPDNFPELKVGPTVLYPRRTDFPAERSLCTGTTAKGCYLRVLNVSSACGVTQSACVAYCPSKPKTRVVIDKSEDRRPVEPSYPKPRPTEPPDQTVKADDWDEPYPPPTRAYETVKADDKTEPYPPPSSAWETVKAEDRIEPKHKEPPVETVRAEPTIEPEHKEPPVETVRAEPTIEPEHKEPPVETVRAEPTVEPEHKEPPVETVYAEPRVEPDSSKPRGEPAVPTVMASPVGAVADEPAAPTVAATLGGAPSAEPAVLTVIAAAVNGPPAEPAVPTVFAAPAVEPPVLP